jgi:GABA(A) receptor-associated protein
MSFKNLYSLNQRKNECEKILLKYPNRIPIICEKNYNSINAPDIDKHKYLVSRDLTLGQFMHIIRQRMNLSAEVGLYIFISGFIPTNSQFLSNLYVDFRDDDGFLYIIYDIENTFGSFYDFKKGDLVHLIKDNIVDKTISYLIQDTEIIAGGNWHDGYSDTYYAYLENTTTNIIEKKLIAYISMMNNINLLYVIKINN